MFHSYLYNIVISETIFITTKLKRVFWHQVKKLTKSYYFNNSYLTDAIIIYMQHHSYDVATNIKKKNMNCVVLQISKLHNKNTIHIFVFNSFFKYLIETILGSRTTKYAEKK